MHKSGRLRRFIKVGLILVGVGMAATFSFADRPADATSATTLTVLDDPGNAGGFQSLVLDAVGNPVVSYLWSGAGPDKLRILHCDDPNCDGLGESITAPAEASAIFLDDGHAQTSIALDSLGNPVVAFIGLSAGVCCTRDVKLLHCDDPNCEGSGDTVTSPVTIGANLGGNGFVSLVLDAAGNPVISYKGDAPFPNKTISILHCNDPDCDGFDESITSPETDLTNDRSGHTSIALDGSGNPVVSYLYEGFGGPDAVRIMHCNDPDCAGDDESITAYEILTVSQFSSTSLVLNSAGNPVVAWGEVGVWVLSCDDPNCDGTGESPVLIDKTRLVGGPSLLLDENDIPMVAFSNSRQSTIVRCGNQTCSSGNSISVLGLDIGSNWDFGRTAAALDALGNPVISFSDRHNINLAHCYESTCGNVDSDGDGCFDILELSTVHDGEYGGDRDPKNPWDFYDVLGPGAALPLDQVIDLPNDILGVIQHFSPSGAPPYDVQFDRGRSSGPNMWNMTAPDGVIDLPNDILGVIQQFGHNCQLFFTTP